VVADNTNIVVTDTINSVIVIVDIVMIVDIIVNSLVAGAKPFLVITTFF